MPLKRKKRKKRSTADDVVDAVETRIKKGDKEKKLKEKELVSSGSTLLNLALSNLTPHGGYKLGTVVHLIGDTHAGKSLLALTMMAEASINPLLSKHHLNYEEVESAMFFPIEEMFGKNAKKRINFIPESKKRDHPRTVQEWHDTLMTSKVPFIHVTDSFDALTSQEELKKESPKKGGYNVEKAAVASMLFPKMVGKIETSKSLFFWISQLRDNVGVQFGPKKGYSGGNAIKFFRSYEIWLAVECRIKRKVRGKDREVGAQVRVKIKKNKFTGRIVEVSFPVYYDYGVDDIGSMIDWMVSEGYWHRPKNSTKIETEDEFIDGTPAQIIKDIEERNLEPRLKEIVSECWFDLENAIKSKRKNKY